MAPENPRYVQTLSDLFVAELEEKVVSEYGRTEGRDILGGNIEVAPATSLQVSDRLGESLVRARLITADQLSTALAHQLMHGGRLGRAVVALGFASETDVARVQARVLGVEFQAPEHLDISPEVAALLPEGIVRKYEVIPLGEEGGKLLVGMVDPTNVFAIDDIRFIRRNAELRIRLITPSVLVNFVETFFGKREVLAEEEIATGIEPNADMEMPDLADAAFDEVEQLKEEMGAANVIQLQNEASLPPIIRLGNYILAEALKKRASDIHIECYESTFRIRFRIDGVLHTILTPPRAMHQPFISRMKIMSGMDISVHRLPQDGHLAVRLHRETNHFRVSVLPTSYGEKCVIRLLKKEAHLADVNKLGFVPELLAEVKRVAKMSQGLVLVTGPTGSGKTTTLHAVINFINEPGINIVTLEDPVEMTIAGVNHVPVAPKGGVTFASGLRSILRQDPDVVFVGEMRDEEVSGIAVKAALTGHLVLSTLHTNGVIETFGRLIDMHVEPYLVASSVRLVMAQRLMRRLCTDCMREEAVPLEIVEEFHLDGTRHPAPESHHVPVGCPSCMSSGYRGRVAVYEAIIPDDEFKRLLRKGASEESLVQYSKERKLRTMFEDALDKVYSGVSTFAEVRRILAGV
jgi:type IV pilus assembly protein PilB